MMVILPPPSCWCIHKLPQNLATIDPISHCPRNPSLGMAIRVFWIPNLFICIQSLNNKSVCTTLGMVKQALTLDLHYQREMGHLLTSDPRDYARTWAWECAVRGWAESYCLPNWQTRNLCPRRQGFDECAGVQTTAKRLPDAPPKTTQGFRKARAIRVVYTGSCTLERALFCGKPPWQTNVIVLNGNPNEARNSFWNPSIMHRACNASWHMAQM